MHIHLVIVQPNNYVHSQIFLDTADYLRYWLGAGGVSVTIAKNRLRHDCANVVFGAHLGVPSVWRSGEFCVYFFNLEQIGLGGINVSADYASLLSDGAVVDYHPSNVEAYRPAGSSVPLLPFLNAPYLNPIETEIDFAKRPIDLLFFGSVNAERHSFLKRIESKGLDVAVFDSPTYYEERDAYVRQAKAVINTSFYAAARFEQVRAFNVLSQGAALVSYLQAGQQVDPLFSDYVFWLDDSNFDQFFGKEFAKPAWCKAAQSKYTKWITTNPGEAVSNLLADIAGSWVRYAGRTHKLVTPQTVVQSQDGNYYHDAINLSPQAIDQADLTIDLCAEQEWPWVGHTLWGQHIQLAPDQVTYMLVRRLPEGSSQWRALLNNATALLAEGGQLQLELSMQDIHLTSGSPPHVQQGNLVLREFSEQFWRAGLFEHRLEAKPLQFLDADGQIVDAPIGVTCRMMLEKRITSSRERTQARTHLPNFGPKILITNEQ